MQKQISSIQNKTVKKLVQLQEKSRARRKEKSFIIEGLREINLALAADYELETIYCCPDIFEEPELLMENFSQFDTIELSKEVYQKVAYRGSTEGILALAKAKENSLASLQFNSENPLILVAEAPEKPGNIGALLRTADAANVDAVLITNPKTDIYNPNIIRSSVGCVFTNQIASGSTSEIITYLKEKNIAIYTAILQESEIYTNQDFTSATAIIVGTEADGLSEEWRKAAKQNIHIPMQGKIDSMNVSVAAGILIFEAKRQRGFE
ncbi:TrmH family RNA methyltransferase [Mesonia aquimarina]|uniref:TrmH family RNA methyltransferase n=1 Tax=Mesonia aquimarina TaxID=1504967 RepID=UPI000EF5866E|nr:RNA methyltransferase [Mesonia aquimarina]